MGSSRNFHGFLGLQKGLWLFLPQAKALGRWAGFRVQGLGVEARNVELNGKGNGNYVYRGVVYRH